MVDIRLAGPIPTPHQSRRKPIGAIRRNPTTHIPRSTAQSWQFASFHPLKVLTESNPVPQLNGPRLPTDRIAPSATALLRPNLARNRVHAQHPPPLPLGIAHVALGHPVFPCRPRPVPSPLRHIATAQATGECNPPHLRIGGDGFRHHHQHQQPLHRPTPTTVFGKYRRNN